MWGELAANLQQGNMYMIAMLALAFLALVVIFERIITLTVVYNLNFDKFIDQIKKAIGAEDYERARVICQNASKTSLPMIAKHAIDVRISDPDRVKAVIDEEALGFLPKIEVRITSLITFATLILLIGVLATIDSLWQAFHSVDILDSEQKQATISQGLASALNPTALGLLIAILIIAGQHLVRGMALSLMDKIQVGIAVLQNFLIPKAGPMMTMAMAAPAGAPVIARAAENFDAVSKDTEQVIATPGTSNEQIDDTTVEDIKDEEEII